MGPGQEVGQPVDPSPPSPLPPPWECQLEGRPPVLVPLNQTPIGNTKENSDPGIQTINNVKPGKALIKATAVTEPKMLTLGKMGCSSNVTRIKR